MSPLLAPSVVAALIIAEHEHHAAAAAWFSGQQRFALTPVTEAAALRFLLRLGESPQTALEVLAGVRQHPRCEFWPTDLSCTELSADDIDGADQFGDAYLVGLAAAHGDVLATLDPGLAARFPDRTVLIAS